MQDTFHNLLEYAAFALDVLGALAIVLAVLYSLLPPVLEKLRGRIGWQLTGVRRRLGRGLVLAGELLIASDVL